MIQVIDNLLTSEQHKNLSQVMLKGGILPWKFNDRKVSMGQDSVNNYQFTHVFYTFHSVTGNTRHIVSKEMQSTINLALS